MSVCFPLGEQIFQSLCKVRDKTIQVFKRPRHVIILNFEDEELEVDDDYSVYV